MNELHSTGRGGLGNLKVGEDEASISHLSTDPKALDLGSGRGGVGNIEAAKALQHKLDEEKARKNALIAQKARKEAHAAADVIRMPEPARST